MLLTRAAISKVHYIYDTLRPNLQIQKEYTQYDFIDIEISQHAYQPKVLRESTRKRYFTLQIKVVGYEKYYYTPLERH